MAFYGYFIYLSLFKKDRFRRITQSIADRFGDHVVRMMLMAQWGLFLTLLFGVLYVTVDAIVQFGQ
jgi:hypothetical protein